MTDNESRKWLHDKMQKNGYNVGSYEEFGKALQNKEGADWCYDKATKMGLNVGTRDEFDKLVVAFDQNEREASQPTAVTDTQAEDNAVFEANAQRFREGKPIQKVTTEQVMNAQPIPGNEIQRLEELRKNAQMEIDSSSFFDRFFNPETRAAVATRDKAEETLELYNEAQHADEGWFDRNVLGVFRGIADKADNLSTWDFGATGVASAVTLGDVSKKWENGEQLTPAEQNMLDAYGLAAAVQSAYQDKVGMAYNVGGSLPESAGFMAAMALNPAGRLGAKAAEVAAKAAAKKYGKSLVTKLAKGAGRAAGDVVGMGIGTITTGVGRVFEDYHNRLNGQATYDVDDKGIIRYGGQYDQEEADAAGWKAFGSNFIENYSEALGNYFSPLGNMLSNLTAKGLKAAHLGRVAETISDISSSQFSRGLQRFKEATKFDGLVGEYLEEVAGNFMNAATVGDMNFNSPDDPNSVFNPETNIETFLSCALMSGTMYAIEAPITMYNKNTAKKKLNTAEAEASTLWGERWADMRSQMDEADPQLLAQLLQGVRNAEDLSEAQKKAAMNYGMRLMEYQGYNARHLQTREESTPEALQATDAYESGLDNVGQPGFVFQANRAKQRAGEALKAKNEAAFNTIDTYINEGGNVEDIINGLDEESAPLAREYYNQSMRMKGVVDGTQDKADEAVFNEIKAIRELTDPQTGLYAEVDRLTVVDGKPTRVPGNIVGWIGEGENRSPVWLQEGMENKKENHITLKKTEYNPEEVKEYPAETIIQWSVDMINDNAQKNLEDEIKYSPDVKDSQMVQGQAFETPSAVYMPFQQTPEGNGWQVEVYDKDESGKPAKEPRVEVVTNEQYRDMMQAQKDAEEAVTQQEVAAQQQQEAIVQPMAESVEQPTEAPQQVGVAENETTTPEVVEQAPQVSELDALVATLPKTAKNEIDYGAMTPQQSYEYTRLTESPETALADLQADIEANEAEIAKVEEQIATAKGGKRNELRDKARKLKAEQAELRAFYDSVVPKVESVHEQPIVAETQAEEVQQPVIEQSANVESSPQEAEQQIMEEQPSAPTFPMTEKEYAEKRSAEIMQTNPEMDDVEAYNKALDEYPSYIGEMINNGTLSEMYAKASIKERVALGKIVQAAGYETSAISQKAGVKEISNAHAVGETVVIRYLDGSLVEGVVEKAENGKVSVRSNVSKRIFTVPESRIVDKSTLSEEQQTKLRTIDVMEEARIIAEDERRKPLRERAEEWGKALGVEVTLLESMDEIPDAGTRRQIEAEHARGKKVPGWVTDGKAYFLMEDIQDVNDVDLTYVHEVIAHIGMERLLGKERYGELCDKVWEMMPQSQKDFFEKTYAGVKEEKNEKLRHRKAADEYIAHLAEKQNLTPEEKSVWYRIIAALRQLLDQALNGLLSKSRITDQDLSELIRMSYANLKSGASANVSTGEQTSRMRAVERIESTFGEVDADKGDVRFAVRDVLTGAEREQAIKDLMAVTGRSRRTVQKWLKAEESLAKVILAEDNVALLDIEADESVPSIWKNSDYPQGTVEFSNICKKRLPFTTIYQRLQKEFPNTVIDAQTLNVIRETMKNMGEDVACALCFVEDRRQLLGEIGEGFINAVKGKDVEVNDKQKAALAKLKESGDKYVPTLFDILTLDGMKELRKKHPAVAQAFIEYNNARGMQSGRLFQAYSAYNREILNYNQKKVDSINNNGGLRIFSFSDFEAHHLIDLVQVLTDCAAKGIKVQGYTKVPEFAKAVKDTGAKINRSLIPKGVGYVDADYVPQEGEAVSPNVINGKRLLFDTVEGIDVNHPDFFDSSSSKSVGNILVAINDEHARLAMADPFVDYIIGFHSGQAKNILKGKGIGDWVNYKNEQLDKTLVVEEDGKQKIKNAPNHGLNIYTDVLNPAEAEGNPIRTAKQFTERFLAECAKREYIPRFFRFLNRAKDGRYLYTPGYHKFLIDFKLFDKNGRILPQEAVIPVFDNEFNKQILDDYVKDMKEELPNDEVYDAVKEAIGLGEGTRFRFIGEKGAANLDNAEEATTRLDNLAVAREMESADKDAKTIKIATGWERGADGKWRYETEDVKFKGLDWVTQKKPLKWSDIIDDKELFEAYPSLLDVKIKKGRGYGGGSYSHSKKELEIGLGRIRKNIEWFGVDNVKSEAVDELKEIVVHELQHAIQRIEGFSAGGNSSTVVDPEILRKIDQLDSEIKGIFEEWDKMPSSEKKISNPKARRMNDEVGAKKKEIERLYKIGAIGDEGYKRLAGEVESRNVESRMKMTPEQRRQSLASETEDVAREDQIFLNDALGVSNMEAVGLGEGKPRFRVVYHGTGSSFDKFDHSHMGEGAGSQAFGWGTYLSESESIGRSYASMHPNATGLEKSRLESERSRLLEAIPFRRGEALEYSKRKLADIENALSSLGEPSRYLYEVEIPDEKRGNYIVWGNNVTDAAAKKVFDGIYNRLSTEEEYDNPTAKKELKRELDSLKTAYGKGKSGIWKDLYGDVSSYLGSDKDASLFLNSLGYVGIKYPAGTIYKGDYNGAHNYVIFNEDDIKINSSTRFRISNENQEIFVSNAAKAVEGIKQNKATPQQWLAMVEKNGGLKAGEDKWLGLSDWLKDSKVKTLTKDEVLDFINENKIQIEEVHYGDIDEDAAYDAKREAVLYQMEEDANRWANISVNREHYDTDEEYQEAFDSAVEEYMEDDLYGHNYAKAEKKVDEWWKTNTINDTRLNYTTEGLENKHEIALTVPTIEPYNESDEIHFGDAGGGRAVAWIRFGDTSLNRKTEENNNLQTYIDQLRKKYGEDEEILVGRFGAANLTDELVDAITYEELYEYQRLTKASMESADSSKSKVLVIDEIQSKRHQDGREQGYKLKTPEILKRHPELGHWIKKQEEAKQKLDNLREQLGNRFLYNDEWTEEEKEQWAYHRYEYEQAEKGRSNYILEFKDEIDEARKGVPSAPFEKNWQELAMKRMLRYAAENGYDKVAWTTGAQQAERYSLANVIDSISIAKSKKNEGQYYVTSWDKDVMPIGAASGHKTAEELEAIFGKELARNLIEGVENLEPGSDTFVLEGTDLEVGGEGMKAFYDKMLPSFVSKYVKKWGAKVEKIELPHLEEPAQTMWSVDVTDAMKESVMEGQTMFRITEKMDEIDSAVNDFKKEFKTVPVKVVNSEMSDKELEKALDGMFKADDIRKFMSESKTMAGYFRDLDKVVIFAEKMNVPRLKESLFHENIHAVLHKGNHIRLFVRFYENAKDDEAFAKWKGIVENKEYKVYKRPEEFFAYVVSNGMANDNLEDVLKHLDKEQQSELKLLLNKLGYDYDNRRKRSNQSDAEGEQSVQGSDGRTGGLSEEGGRRDSESKLSPAERRERLIDLFGNVADMGLRGVVGDANYDMAMIEVFYALPEADRVDVSINAVQNLGGNVAAATSEYLEGKEEPTLMEKIVAAVRGMLRKAGIDLDVNTNEVKYLLWRSKKPINRNSTLDMAEDIDMKYRLKVGEHDGSPTRFRTKDSEESMNQRVNDFKTIYSMFLDDEYYLPYYAEDAVKKAWEDIIVDLKKEHGENPTEFFKNMGEVMYNRLRPLLYDDYANATSFSQMTNEDSEELAEEYSEYFQKVWAKEILKGEDAIRKYIPENVLNAVLPKGNSVKFLSKDVVGVLSNVTGMSFEEVMEQYGQEDYEMLTDEDFKALNSEGGTRFRVSGKAEVRDEYEATIKKGSYQAREAVQDSMLSLRRAIELIEKVTGKKVQDFENAYIAENKMSSIVKANQDEQKRKFYKPMMEAVKTLMKASDKSETEVADYLILKHGIERNREMAVRKVLVDDNGQLDLKKLQDWFAEKKRIKADPKYDTWRKQQEAMDDAAINLGADMSRDYSGLTSMFPGGDLADCTEKAYDEVEAYEAAYPTETAEVLGRIKAYTQNTLDYSFKSGLMSRAVYDELSNDMYDYYIPLRGFDETTSDEVYAYLDNERGAFNAPVMRAKGRTSKSDNPIAYIKSIADSGIVQGERNKMKQTFLNMVLNHPTDLVSVREGVWAVYDPSTDQWTAVAYPTIPNDATPSEVEQIMSDFEDDMQKKSETDDNIKLIRESDNIPYRVLGDRMNQHQIIVKRMGKTYTLTVNGNPRLALAVNGKTNPHNTSSDGKVAAAAQKVIDSINRNLAAWYTTRNPDFVASNFMRDTFYTNTIVRAKEGNKYANKFHVKYAKLLKPGRMISLFSKLENGTLDMSKPMEKSFYEFIMNGGETGYSNLVDIEQIKRDVSKKLKGSRMEKVSELIDKFDRVNRAVENTARFAAYLTSREMGRSVTRSVFDAKEISVNFNKKGAGGTFFGATGQTKMGNLAAAVGAGGRALYVFFNAAIQGTTNLLHVWKGNKTGTTAGMSAMFLMGAVIPFLLDDDDEKDYYDIPEHVRRNHLILPGSGDAWISIPLPIEYRIMYGMGELLTSWRTGHERGSDIGRKMLNLTGQALPLNFLEEGLDAFVPSAISPIYQVATNTSWTGLPIYKDNEFNKNDPEYTKAYSNVDRHLVAFSKALYDWTFDEENQKEGIDINPAVIESLAKGYFGGAMTLASNAKKVFGMIGGEQEFDWRNVPIANRALKTGDERTKEKRVTNEYFENIEKLEFIQARERTLKKVINGAAVPEVDKFKADKDYETMRGSDIYQKYMGFKRAKKKVDDIRKRIKKVGSNDELQKQLMQAQEEANRIISEK